MIRVAYYLVVAVVAGVDVLDAAGRRGRAQRRSSAPSFQPIQLAVLYGYRSEVVVAAVRWGWVLAPLGLGLAELVR